MGEVVTADDDDRIHRLHVLANIQTALNAAADGHKLAAMHLCCDYIEDHRVGPPQTPLLNFAHESVWWAKNATPRELETYLLAIAENMRDTDFHQKVRKRIMGALFVKMSKEDQRALMAWAQTKMEEVE